MIPYGRQDITEEDVNSVLEVLESNFITQGPKVPQFEQAIATKVMAKHAVAVNSATSALHIACLALKVSPGDWVWTSPITFIASANCAIFCGAKIDFVDIDPRTYNLSVNELEKKLQEAEKKGVLPKVVIPVHLCGQSCEMEEIFTLSKRYGFSIIEDASHAIGAYYKNYPVGSCRYSDITVFSFHPVKIITTGEGGMAVTNRSDLAHSMELLRAHGMTRDSKFMTRPSEGPWYYQQLFLGFNYRLTELQAALGISQLTRLEKYISKRQSIAQKYNDSLLKLPILLPEQHSETYSSFHLYPVLIKLNESKISRKNLFIELRKAGVGVNVHYIPVHLQPYYQKFGFSSGDFPVAENYYERAISIPIFYNLTESQQDFIIDQLHELLI